MYAKRMHHISHHHHGMGSSSGYEENCFPSCLDNSLVVEQLILRFGFHSCSENFGIS